jgi:hypothetical protein
MDSVLLKNYSHPQLQLELLNKNKFIALAKL